LKKNRKLIVLDHLLQSHIRAVTEVIRLGIQIANVGRTHRKLKGRVTAEDCRIADNCRVRQRVLELDEIVVRRRIADGPRIPAAGLSPVQDVTDGRLLVGQTIVDSRLAVVSKHVRTRERQSGFVRHHVVGGNSRSVALRGNSCRHRIEYEAKIADDWYVAAKSIEGGHVVADLETVRNPYLPVLRWRVGESYRPGMGVGMKLGVRFRSIHPESIRSTPGGVRACRRQADTGIKTVEKEERLLLTRVGAEREVAEPVGASADYLERRPNNVFSILGGRGLGGDADG
jgi:hypothetical protein